MTENKRFELAYEKGNWWAVRDGDITLWKEEVIHLLNELHEENQKLLTLSNMKKGALVEAIKDLTKENEELKQRNDRQAKQLDRLYSLIEEKDWTALSDIIDDFKRCEEQLQNEWGIYNESE